MSTVPDVRSSSPATLCISVDLPEPGRAHDGGEAAGRELDGHAVEGSDLVLAPAVHLDGVDDTGGGTRAGTGGGARNESVVLVGGKSGVVMVLVMVNSCRERG